MASIERIWRYAVVGKTLCPTGRDRDGLMAAIADCWRNLLPNPEIMPITDEIYVVRFKKPEHLKIAMEMGPWRVYGQIFLIKKHSFEIAPEGMSFDSFKIWFYFEGLPYLYRSENDFIELLDGITNMSGIYPEHSYPKDSRGFRIQTVIKCGDPLPLGVEANDGMGGGTTTTRGASAECGECWGILHVTLWAYSLGYTHIMIETDHRDAANFLCDIKHNLGWISASILDDVLWLSMLFESFSVVYVNRKCNYVAHSMASHARLLGDSLWEWLPPVFLIPHLNKDANDCNIMASANV